MSLTLESQDPKLDGPHPFPHLPQAQQAAEDRAQGLEGERLDLRRTLEAARDLERELKDCLAERWVVALHATFCQVLLPRPFASTPCCFHTLLLPSLVLASAPRMEAAGARVRWLILMLAALLAGTRAH